MDAATRSSGRYVDMKVVWFVEESGVGRCVPVISNV